MRAVEASDANQQQTTPAGEAGDVSLDASGEGSAQLGQRLRAARERLGWSRADVATRLKLPVNLIGRLESDDYEGMTQGVFLRGYLGSYTRLVGLPQQQAVSVAAANTQLAPLIATGTISRSRYLFDRYSVSATYLILTAIIVVPAVWLATHGGLEQNLARTTPLDPPAAAIAASSQETPSPTSTTGATNDAVAATTIDEAPSSQLPAAPVEQTPVIASMTPFASSSPNTPPPAPPVPDKAEPATASTPASAGSGAHVLQLKLGQQSWVEVLGADGRKLEYATLAGGTERSYRSDGPITVRLGNAQGAEVRSDGTPVDLSPFQHGNVAHIKLFAAPGSEASRVE